MSIKREISLHWDRLVDGTKEGVFMDLDVYDNEIEEEEYIPELCKGNIGFAETWEQAIPIAKELAKENNAEFNESLYN